MISQTKQAAVSGRNRLEDSPLSDIIINQEDAEQLYTIYPDLPRSHMQGCPSCGKNKGLNVDGEVTLDGITYTCNCKDQLQRHKHYLNAGIGLTYQIIDWADYHSDPEAYEGIRRYADEVRENVEAGVGFLLFSNANGVGKTTLAMLAAKAAVMAGINTFCTTYSDMLSSMRAGWRDPNFAKWYKQRIDSAQVLLIDDVGKEVYKESGFSLEFSTQTLDSLIRTRVQQNRPTLITSNYGAEAMEGAYGHALMSLLMEQGECYELVGEDYRPKVIKKRKGKRRIY